MCEETVHVIGNLAVMTFCRMYTGTRDAKARETALDVKSNFEVTLQCGRCSIEIKINSVQIENTVSWVVIRRGLDSYVTPLSEGNTNSTGASSSTVHEIFNAQGDRWRLTS